MARIESLDVVAGAVQAPNISERRGGPQKQTWWLSAGADGVRIRRFILRLAGYKTPVGTGPSSRR
jgi:hypothetical protein